MRVFCDIDMSLKDLNLEAVVAISVCFFAYHHLQLLLPVYSHLHF